MGVLVKARRSFLLVNKTKKKRKQTRKEKVEFMFNICNISINSVVGVENYGGVAKVM